MRCLSLIAALSVLAAVIATPITDLSATTVDVSVDPALPMNATSIDTFSVTVERVDELVNEYDGSLLAARVVDIVFKFDVDNDDILVNGRPVPLGVSSVEVTSGLMASGVAMLIPDEILEDAFDTGIAAIEVHAEADIVSVDVSEIADVVAEVDHVDRADLPSTMEIRRVTVQLRVLEINGAKVMQSDMVEQVLDVLPSGRVVKKPPRSVAMLDGGAAKSSRYCGMHQRVAALWHRLPAGTRVLVAAFLGSLLLLVFFVALPLAFYVHVKERRVDYNRVRTLEPLMEVDEEDFEDDVPQGYHAPSEKLPVYGPAPAYH